MEGVHLTPAAINTLTLLGYRGQCSLLTFSRDLVSTGVYISWQSAMNAISRLCKTGIMLKVNTRPKTIMLCQRLQEINKKGSLLHIKALYK